MQSLKRIIEYLIDFISILKEQEYMKQRERCFKSSVEEPVSWFWLPLRKALLLALRSRGFFTESGSGAFWIGLPALAWLIFFTGSGFLYKGLAPGFRLPGSQSRIPAYKHWLNQSQFWSTNILFVYF